jgi:hypothetical protein
MQFNTSTLERPPILPRLSSSPDELARDGSEPWFRGSTTMLPLVVEEAPLQREWRHAVTHVL